MSDGVPITPGAGVTIATDDAGAAGQVQIVKLAVGTDGSAVVLPADATHGLTVDAQTVTALLGALSAPNAGSVNGLLTALLAELGQKLETGGQVALDAGTLAALETIQVGGDPATNTTLASVLAAVDTLELLATGPDTVYRGTTGFPVTIDLAAGERLHSVLVVPTAGGQVTVTVPGAAADQAPIDFPYAEDFRGGLGGPEDVVIAGAVAYYRVTTLTP